LGQFVRTYDITNLWGLMDAHEQAANQSQDRGHSMNFIFDFQTDLQWLNPAASWRSKYFWPYDNFDVAELSKDQFAQTYSDVESNPQWYNHPFDFAFYELAYKGSANGGTCFGMCVEAIYALVRRSLFSEPIYNNPVLNYPSGLQSGNSP